MAPNIRHQHGPSASRHGRIGKRALLGIATILLVGGAVAYAAVEGKLPQWFYQENTDYDLITAPVKRGELRLTVVATGNLDSASNVTLSSNVKGSTKIISIVPEGTLAYEGMTLVKLDASVYQDNLDEQKIKLTQAEAMRDQAKDALEIQETVNESDVAAAKLQVKLADLDLEKYLKGDFEVLETAAESKITLAKETLSSSRDAYAFAKKQSKKGYVNQNELEQKRIAVKTAELKLKEAELELQVLHKYQKQRELAEKEANAEEFKRELQRTIQKAEAALSQAKADLAAREMTATVERTKLEKLEEQIAQCTIVAPQAGQVIYATESSRRSNQERVIEEGASVDNRQAIIKLPDMSQMQVDTRIHESKIGRVQEGMPAIIKVSRKSDRFYQGEVDTVASVPNSPSWRQPDLREYTAVIRVINDSESIGTLKPGLTAEVEIISDILDDVLKVPVQAVIARNDQYFVFALTPQGPEIRQIYIGATNDVETEVREIETAEADAKFPVGVAEDEEVVLAPRTSLPDLFTVLEDAVPEKPVAEREQKAAAGRRRGGKGRQSTGERSPGQRQSSGDGPRREAGRGKRGPQNGKSAGQKGGAPGSAQMSAFFDKMDKNNDGQLTKDEVAGGRLASSFDRIDANSDGNVDKAEFEVAIAQFAKQRGGGGGSQ